MTLWMMIAFQLRKWLALNDDVDLTEAEVAQVFAFTDMMDDSLGVVGMLRGAARAMDPALAALARLLTHLDLPGSRFEIHPELADGDEDSLAVGMYVWSNVAAHGFDDAVKRQAVVMYLRVEDGAAYGRELLQRVLTDIHDLTHTQRVIEAERQ